MLLCDAKNKKNIFIASVVSFKPAGCINLGWSVKKTVHCRVLNLPGDEKS